MTNENKEVAEYLADRISSGLFRRFVGLFVLLIISSVAFSLISMAITPTDDTDLSRWTRSGVKIVTDYGTGKEYLVTPEGGITERVE